MTRRIVITLSIAASVTASGCGDSSEPPAQRPTRVIMIGHSGSDRAQAGYFRAETARILTAARLHHDRVLVSIIGAPNTSHWPVDVTFNSTGGNSFGRDRKDRALQDGAERTIAEMLAAPSPPGSSDLVAASLSAADVMRQLPSSVPKEVWFLSDAHAVGEGLNLYTADLSAEGIAKELGLLRKQTTLASLKDVSIHFNGVSLDRSRLKAEREQAIGRFWAAWSQATGGRLVSYTSHDITSPSSDAT